jgi:hypothetical protein
MLKRFTSSSDSFLIEDIGPVPYHDYPSKGLMTSPVPGRCYSVVDLWTCGPRDYLYPTYMNHDLSFDSVNLVGLRSVSFS